jgi:TatD DNase family protein
MPAYSLIDSHCHLDFSDFDSDRAAVMKRGAENGVTDIVVPGALAGNWAKIRELCAAYPKLHPCYGLHPYWADRHNKNELEKLRQQIDSNPCVAIGECGLDYRPQQTDREKQQYFFEAQLDIALEKKLPVVIHAVRATEAVIAQIRRRPSLCGMMHSYSGSYEQALQLIDLGFYLSFGGAISYERAHKLRDTARQLPLTSLLLETDAPDQADASHQGQRNEPAHLVNVLNVLCELREETAESIAQQTSRNARSLFNI